MTHSCGDHRVAAFMEGKGPTAWALWEKVNQMVGRCGPHSVVANKTRLEFMVRVRFAGVDAVSERGMSLSFWLKRRIDNPRFRKVERLGARNWVYHLRLTGPDELDDEVQDWLCQSYEVGCERV